MSTGSFSERFAAWFEGRRWRVMTELSGIVAAGGIRVAYDRGAFEIAQPGVYVTPLGNRGRRGYLVVETGADGRDLPVHARRSVRRRCAAPSAITAWSPGCRRRADGSSERWAELCGRTGAGA